MNKRTRIALALSVVLLGVLWLVYFLIRDTNTMNPDHSYDVRTGETFTVQLPTNPSTGYSQCWINETDAQHVQLTRRETKVRKPEMAGSGGTLSLTFTATSTGTDTLRFRDIPPSADCSDFRSGSTKAEYTFVVRISN